MAQIVINKPSNIGWKTWFRSRCIALWEVGGVLFINLFGGFLHFAFEGRIYDLGEGGAIGKNASNRPFTQANRK